MTIGTERTIPETDLQAMLDHLEKFSKEARGTPGFGGTVASIDLLLERYRPKKKTVVTQTSKSW